jgi:PAS domain-containing protein
MINCELGTALNAMFTDGLTATFSGQQICDRCELDLSAEQLSTERLLSSAGYMRMVLEAMSDIVLLVDQNGGQIDMIPTQWTHQNNPYGIEVLNQTIENFLDPNYAPIWLAPVQTAIAEQQITRFEYHLTIKGAVAWFTASISPMPNQRAIWVARDITDRKLAEQTTQQANARLAQSIQALEHRNQKLGQLRELSDLL